MSKDTCSLVVIKLGCGLSKGVGMGMCLVFLLSES